MATTTGSKFAREGYPRKGGSDLVWLGICLSVLSALLMIAVVWLLLT